jgi:cell division protein FtsZ
MTIKLSLPEVTELKPRITVIGVGGAGGNAVNNMISANLEGIDFVAANTDAQALSHALTERRIQLGINATQGLGAGARPEIGREAAVEANDEIMDHIQNSHMVFITAGMGGGTGTGAAPVIAKSTREQGILTVGVVTKPFHFEGGRRMEIAEAGIAELQNYVDTLIIIPNQNLFRVANEETTFAHAFRMADEVLSQGVRGVTDLMVMPGLINLDFADVRSVMHEMGKAMMGTGEAEGANRSIEAAEAAISNPLLEDVSMKGATGLLINITGGPDMTLMEVDEAANRVREEVDSQASIIFGTSLDPELEGRVRVSIIATGIESDAIAAPPPLPMPRLHVVGDARVHTPLAETYEQEVELPTSAESAESPQVMTEATNTIVEVETMEQTMPVEMGEPAAESASATMEALPEAVALVNEEDALMEAKIGALVNALSEHDEAASAEMASVEVAVAPEPAPQAEVPPPVDAFIPPKPMEAQPRAPRVQKPEPFAEAAMTNGARTASNRTGSPSLLERMTGTGRARKAKETTDDSTMPSAMTSTPPEDSMTASTAPAPSAEAVVAPALPQVAASDRLAPPRPDEDLLDIPAFLRRQAN